MNWHQKVISDVRDRSRWLVQRTPEDTEEYRASVKVLEGWPSLDGSEASKLEYLKTLLALAADDMKHVTVYVSVAFAVTAILLSGKMSEQLLASPVYVRATMLISMALLGLSACFFFRYVRKIHLTRMAITRCIPSLDSARARELWGGKAGVGAIHLRAYNVGITLLATGLMLEGFVAIWILT